jgi:hypothetical protein
MTDVACFCGCLYSFDGGEGPCPTCGAVAAVRTRPLRDICENREYREPDVAAAAASLPARTPVPSGRLARGEADLAVPG